MTSTTLSANFGQAGGRTECSPALRRNRSAFTWPNTLPLKGGTTNKQPTGVFASTSPRISEGIENDARNHSLTSDKTSRWHLAERHGDFLSRLDLNGDETVDLSDVHHWVTDLNSTFIGDTNLDGEVQFDDFAALSAHFGQAGG